MDIPRHPRNPDREAIIKARQEMAGRFGFGVGCMAAVAAMVINLYRAPHPLTVFGVAFAVLMAALNMPVGIGLGLLGERLLRSPDLREP